VCFDMYVDFVVYTVHGSKKYSKLTQDRSGVFILSVYLTKIAVDLNQNLAILIACCSVLHLSLIYCIVFASS
jgi:hypothetical protein